MSPPGMAAAGFVCGVDRCPRSRRCTVRPGCESAAAVKAELDRQRPSAARRGYGPPLAPGPGRVSRAVIRCACRARRRVGCKRRRWWITSCRTAVTGSCSGTRRTGLRCASPATMPRPRARAAGADDRRAADPAPAGGRSVAKRLPCRDRAGRALCIAAKFGRGVSGRSAAESLDSCPQKHLDSWPFVRF